MSKFSSLAMKTYTILIIFRHFIFLNQQLISILLSLYIVAKSSKEDEGHSLSPKTLYSSRNVTPRNTGTGLTGVVGCKCNCKGKCEPRGCQGYTRRSIKRKTIRGNVILYFCYVE